MKKYVENDKNFILNYEVRENKIYVNYANGEYKMLDKTEQNEKNIIEEMKQQVHDAHALKKQLAKDFKQHKSDAIICSIISIAWFSIIAVTNPDIGTLILLTLPSSIGGLISIVHGIIAISDKRLLSDIEKNELFLNYEDVINENASKNNVLKKYFEKTNNYELKNKKKPITINDIDTLSKRQLRKIIDNSKK